MNIESRHFGLWPILNTPKSSSIYFFLFYCCCLFWLSNSASILWKQRTRDFPWRNFSICFFFFLLLSQDYLQLSVIYSCHHRFGNFWLKNLKIKEKKKPQMKHIGLIQSKWPRPIINLNRKTRIKNRISEENIKIKKNKTN